MKLEKLHGITLGVFALLAAPAWAEAERFAVTDPTYRAECGSCHVAYPPQLLDASAWQAIMVRLDRHYGSDASLDAKTAAAIRSYLSTSAGRKTTGSLNGLPRITEARWFVREHDEIPAATWKSDAVKSAANCGACHTRADQGDYSERGVRVPK